jgi:hypothetical protein
MSVANHLEGSSLFTIDDILEDITNWHRYIVTRILPECIVWEQYEQTHQPLPSINEVFLATEWNSKEGATRLSKKISSGCTLQHLLQFFTGKPKCLWVVIATEEPDTPGNLTELTDVKVKSEKIAKSHVKQRLPLKKETIDTDMANVSAPSPSSRRNTKGFISQDHQIGKSYQKVTIISLIS